MDCLTTFALERFLYFKPNHSTQFRKNQVWVYLCFCYIAARFEWLEPCLVSPSAKNEGHWESLCASLTFLSFLFSGCEFFKDYKDRDYTAEGLVFNWNQVPTPCSQLVHFVMRTCCSDSSVSPMTGLCGCSFDNPCVLYSELEHWLDSLPG